ncbi:putative papain family cysteine protease domain containing protein [Monocercomonoides exilis]|uniref:putative papain family cysteine protease domain containing protein n=1 Tax=Monocercomonoides exilis TaxID=2049356 RepID=UPI003559F06B|nr:putative papain family cysteine protease domain containing protein [Monocercomonoides exilis]|eukprot:MONOS_1470.1-p1 / transcript=MONOS_1470.1 / gene=MONOS_1470 / organism=Monocercomonoides_exilis_PA203 / gene_product=papain family cysteine protease domain containing protein / transcript_product=papain family cysteine protease domain containing protein / location=Mono_scaffold00026:72289-74490(+) / protein_length=629 / sequence_SO=supercontig / SO=protein_coding / is_pseudo=false
MKEALVPKEKHEQSLHPCYNVAQLFFICVSIALGIVLTILASIKLHYNEDTKYISYSLHPYKWAVDISMPHKDQAQRGTCWAQSLIGFLEHSYRENGIKRGFLTKDEYVPFSVQAYGLEIVKECQKFENLKICNELDSGPFSNSTEGGEAVWLYYLPNLYTKLYPESLCTYKPDVKEEWDCPNLNESTKGTNPIRFSIKTMNTSYSVEDTKRLLLKKKISLIMSTNVPDNILYIPCNVAAKGEDETYSVMCETSKERVPCPYYINKLRKGDQCLKLEGYDFITSDGEWFLFSRFVAGGGHEMKIVGFNDEWVSREGRKGGFILENSWATGSHSIAFWMQQRSTWNERMVCPNAMDFQNWFTCASENSEAPHNKGTMNGDSTAKGSDSRNHARLSRKIASAIEKTQRKQLNEMKKHPHLKDITSVYEKRFARSGRRFNSNGNSSNEEIDISMCLDADSVNHVIDVMKQPTEFECTAKGAQVTGCDSNTKRYFFMGSSADKNHLVNLYFAAAKREDTKQVELFTVNGVPAESVRRYFKPIKEQSDRLANEVDNCGYNMMPYSFLEESSRHSGTWSSNYLDVEWDDSSYLANKKSYPQYDYSWLEKSQTKQKEWQFEGPFPFTKPENLKTGL